MRRLLILLCFFFLQAAVQAQDSSVKDSLLKTFADTKDDSTRIILLLKVSGIYAKDSFDSSLSYLNKAVTLSNEKKIVSCDAFINNGFFLLYYYDNNYKKASEYGLKNITIAQKIGDDKLLAKTYNNLASSYNEMGNYKSAIDYSVKCLELTERIKDSTGFPLRNLTVSNTYYNLRQYDKSIFYSKRAIAFGKQFDNSFAVLMGLNNMAAAYSGKHEIDSAIIFYREQLQLAEENEDKTAMHYALVNLCQNYFSNNDLAGVEKYAVKLKAAATEIQDKKTIAEIYNVNALRHILRKEFFLAQTQLDSGISFAIKEHADAIGNLYQTYSKLYFMQNRIKEAEDYGYKYDSLQSAANLKELSFYIEDLNVQLETQKKEDQIKLQQAQLDKKTTLNYFLSTGAVALLLILALSYRNYRHRQKLQQLKIDELESEKQLAATEAVLKGEEQERTRLAKDLHDGLGGMLSGIKFSLNNMKGNLVMTPDNAQAFERSIDMLDSSIREMRRVAHNMMPEMLLKYGLDTALKEFCTEIDRTDVMRITYQSAGINSITLDQTLAVTVYRIVQELVSNALKHSKAKNVLVQVHRLENEKLLAITVEDDGAGFDPKKLNQSAGMGWQNIQSRVDFLKGRLDVQSSPGNGTSVMIEISIA
jgi:two-component system NarL family sensor kinase